MGQFELQASLILLLLGWFFVPFYIRSGVFTMPEFLERRYSPAARWYLSVISVIGYVLTKISVTIYAGGVVFEALMGINFWTGALIVVLVTGIYTVLGGLRAVVYTEVLQAFVLIAGSVAVVVIGLNQLGGWSAMMDIAGSDLMSLWKPLSHPEFPWTGMVFGAPIVAVWYWCTDQYIVQRTLSAPDVASARRGTIFAGFLKQLPLFLFVIPGVIAYCLVQTGQLQLDQADEALPVLVQTLLPTGLKGLMVAGLLAALMSSLSAVFNSCSTLITLDIYKKFRPEASERHLVSVGRISTIVLVGLGIAWIPLMSNISGVLYQYLQSVQSYISPPIASVFLLGLLWSRINATGAVTALITGFVLGLTRLVLEINKMSLEGLPLQFASINFLHFAVLLFVICSVVLIIVSLLTPAPARDQIRGLTYETAGEIRFKPGAELPEMVGRPERKRQDLLLSILLILLVAAVMLYFRG